MSCCSGHPALRPSGQPAAVQNRSRRFCRAAGFHCPAGGPGAKAAGPPHSLPRGVRAQQPLPRTGHPGEAWQRRSAHRESRGRRGADTGRTPRGDDVGAAPEAGVRHRYPHLRGLWRGGSDHRLHRGSAGDREDPRSPGQEDHRLTSLPPALPGAAAARLVRFTRCTGMIPQQRSQAAPMMVRPRGRLGRWQGWA